MSFLKQHIHFNPDASITRIAVNKIDPLGKHKLTKEEVKGTEELNKKYPDIQAFIKHLNRSDCDLMNAINKKIYIKCFDDFRTCEQLYKSQTNFIYNCHYPQYYLFYFNKVYKDHVNDVFNHLNIKETEKEKNAE